MGWQDAPVVSDGQGAGPGWQSAPLANAGPPPSGNPVTGTQPQPGMLEKALPYMDPRGIPESALAMGTGMVGQVAGGLAGLAGAMLPGEEGQGARVAERVSSAIQYEPKTKSGQTIMKVAELPAIPVHWAAEQVGDRAGAESPLMGSLGKAGVEALPAVLGLRAGMAPKRPLTSAQQKVADARDAGFKMTPEEMDAGIVPRTAAGLAGEPRLAKGLSRENTATVTAKVKQDLGIKPDAPLDLETLAQIRKDEGAAYATLRQAGPLELDATYLAEIDALGAKYKSAAKDFPGLARPEIENVISALRKDDQALAAAEAQGIKLPAEARQAAVVDSGSVVDLIGTLRESADKAFRGGDTGLAKVMRGGAEALEGQLSRHLKAIGNEEAFTAFENARVRIAKTYAAERALVGDEVNLQSLGRQVQKRKPLTGSLKEGGDFAREFDRSSQKPTHMPTGATIHDMALAGLNGIRTGGGSLALDALTVGARPAVRTVLGSRPAQWAMDPRTNLSAPALEALAVSSTQPPSQMKKR